MKLSACIYYAKSFFRHPQITLGGLYFRLRIRLWHKLTARPVILFRTGEGIGDIICTFPAVLALRERYPDALFVYSVCSRYMPIVKMGKVADIVVESDWPRPVPKVALKDYAMCFYPLLADQVPPGRKHQHLVNDYLETLGLTAKSRQPLLYVPDPLTRIAESKIAPYRGSSHLVIGIHVGPTWAVRQWTNEGWTKLVKLLHEHFSCTIIQLGTDFHSQRGRLAVARISQSVDWVGKFGIEETIAVIKSLDLLVGIDSGYIHIAGAVGTPSVGLFGPVDPRFRLPPETPSAAVTSNVPCLGCHHRTPLAHWEEGCPFSVACMNQLKAEAVFDAVCVMIDNLRSSGKVINLKQKG